MFHYEIVVIIYPGRNIDVNDIINNYCNYFIKNNVKIHRKENWGIKYLAYSINNIYKANYILFNIEVDLDKIKKIRDNLKLNNKILRFLILRKKYAITKPSIMMINN